METDSTAAAAPITLVEDQWKGKGRGGGGREQERWEGGTPRDGGGEGGKAASRAGRVRHVIPPRRGSAGMGAPKQQT